MRSLPAHRRTQPTACEIIAGVEQRLISTLHPKSPDPSDTATQGSALPPLSLGSEGLASPRRRPRTESAGGADVGALPKLDGGKALPANLPVATSDAYTASDARAADTAGGGLSASAGASVPAGTGGAPSTQAPGRHRSSSSASGVDDTTDVAYKATFDLGSVLPLMREGFGAVVEDSFTKCFESREADPWNWNVYLFPMWLAGLVVRYGLLLPLRLAIFILGWVAFAIAFAAVKLVCKGRRREAAERKLVVFICSIFVMSWSGVIKFHHQRPEPLPGKCAGAFVANHSSMIDFIILQASNCYAVVGQQHKGWVGFLQRNVLSCLHCVWFDRGESKNRAAVADKLRAHVCNPDANPLLVFPEGTCVNNRYVMQFKKGVFDLGAQINPVAIRYNPIFVDGYWNSRAVSFQRHLFK